METESSSSPTSSKVESEVKTSQAGLSLGYQFSGFVPYVSYIHEKHEVSTSVTNPSGAFGSYSDSGVHKYLSIGLSSPKPGLVYAFEYNMIQIDWERADKAYQNTVGFKLGYAWQ